MWPRRRRTTGIKSWPWRAEPEVVGLGETGLDRYWDYTPFAQQEDYFARHLELARKLAAPVVIHCRAGRGRHGPDVACGF